MSSPSRMPEQEHCDQTCSGDCQNPQQPSKKQGDEHVNQVNHQDLDRISDDDFLFFGKIRIGGQVPGPASTEAKVAQTFQAPF